LAHDQWRQAVEVATALSEQSPSSSTLTAALGEALFRAGRFEEADAVLAPIVASLNDSEAGTVPAADIAHALVVLGRIRTAEGRDRLAAGYLNHALHLVPDDRWVLYWAAGAAPDRAEIVARLERYLELSDGDDADRIEAARGKIEFYGVLGERRVWVRGNRPDRIEVPLIPIEDGVGGVIGYAMDVRIGSRKPVRLMLDSGSTGLFVLARIAKKRGFEPMAEETVFGGGGKKRHVSPRGLFPKVEIGGLVFTDALVTTTRHEIDPTGRFHGLIGLAVFNGYRIVLELDEPRMVLDRTSAELDRGAAYWDVSGQMLVRATTSAGDDGLFLFDTGATRTAVSMELAEHTRQAELGQGVDITGYGGAIAGARTVHGLSVRFGELVTEGKTVNAVDLSVRSRMGGVEISGYVGLDLLAGKRIVVDTRSRRVEVSPPARRRESKSRKR
jgi:hypothetical protein